MWSASRFSTTSRARMPNTTVAAHAYVADSGNFGVTGKSGGADTEGFDLAEANSSWGFTLDDQPATHTAK